MTPFANRSQFFPITVLAPVDISMPPAFHNVSTFPNKRITTGTEPDLTMPALANVTTFPGITVSEAPEDGIIRMGAAFTNSTTFPEITVSEAPADVEILMPSIPSSTTFGGHVATLSPEDDGADGGEGIASDVIGGMI